MRRGSVASLQVLGAWIRVLFMKSSCVVAGMLLTVAVMVVAGQSQPDFSGRWTLVRAVPADAQAAGTLLVQQLVGRTNVHGAPLAPFYKSITIERQFGDRTLTDSYDIGVQGGNVGGILAGHDPLTPVPQTRFFVRWEGSRLVMDTGFYAGSSREAGPYAERRETWQLDEAGLLTITVADRRSGADSTISTATYRRP